MIPTLGTEVTLESINEPDAVLQDMFHVPTGVHTDTVIDTYFPKASTPKLTDGNSTSKRNKGARLLTDESVRRIKFEAAMTKRKRNKRRLNARCIMN